MSLCRRYERESWKRMIPRDNDLACALFAGRQEVQSGHLLEPDILLLQVGWLRVTTAVAVYHGIFVHVQNPSRG